MVIDTWYEWLFLWSYHMAPVLFAIGTFFLAKKSRDAYAYMAFLGFIMFLVGDYLMISAEQFSCIDGVDAPMLPQFLIGRMISSMSYMVASVGLLLFSIKTYRK